MPTAVYEKAEQLRGRTKQFAYRIVKLFQALPKTTESQVAGKQLLRCGTAVAANYRSACRARSAAEFASRVGVVAEEADETVFWMELLADNGIVKAALVRDLLQEARELTAIFTASRRTAKG